MSRFRDNEMVSGKLVNRQDVLIEDLQRQLAEARGENERLRELGLEAFKLGFELGLNNETFELHKALEEKEEELKQLKEKGE